MGCGSCGGGINPKAIQRTAIHSTSVAKKPQVIAPPNTQKTVLNTKQVKLQTQAVAITPLNSVNKANVRASNTKQCPNCGAMIRTILAGSGPQRRLICTACGRQYSK